MDKPTVISLFTGIGGLDLGFEAAGFRTAVAVESDPACRNTLAANRSWPVAHQDGDFDIGSIDSDRILEVGRLRAGEVDVLIGGPPCQPFSQSGYWRTGDSARLEDPRAGTLRQYLRVLADTRPKAFLLENVPGLGFRGKDEGLRLIREEVGRINRRLGIRYEVYAKVLNAVDYGVPQVRRRLFVVGQREGRPFRFPSPTHVSPELARNGTARYRTAWDALGDLPEPADPDAYRVGGKWGGLLPSIPEGKNYLWHTRKGGGQQIFGWRTRYWAFLLKLAKDLPAWTIQASPGSATGPFHWRSRRLSPAELCRLQTLPDGLALPAAYRDVQRMVGNAVPSLLGEVLAREIRAQLLGLSALRRPLRLAPPDRGTPPLPEPVELVPEGYAPHIGEHPDHPGPGKGPGAVSRDATALITGLHDDPLKMT